MKIGIKVNNVKNIIKNNDKIKAHNRPGAYKVFTSDFNDNNELKANMGRTK